jgi:hypothetical protein
MRGKSLCIVDTSSLINSCEVELGKKSLDKWLWKEFEVKYSKTVLEEFRRGRSRGESRGKLEDHVWPLPTISTYERILFQSLTREIEESCRRCGRIVYRNESFAIDFNDDRDRGERHNCCVALDAIKAGKYPQVIFLIDDFHAVRDYARYFFDTFPLGNTWSLLDFITYLFVRHKDRITLEDTKNALRDANAQGSISLNASDGESEKKVQRLSTYLTKVNRIAEAFSQLSGGYQ